MFLLWGTKLCCLAEYKWESTPRTRATAAAPLSKTWLSKVTEPWSNHCIHFMKCIHTHDHYLPTVSPLLSSGFVPGLFSWSTVCALDEEHPMFGGKKMGWDESKTWNRSKQTRVSGLSVFRDCLAVKTWNAELSPVPKSNWAPLYPLVCLCVHAWPAALLPQTTMCYDHAARQCRQYCWMLPDCLLLTVTLFIQEEEATCAWNVCACVLPSIGVPHLDEIHHLVVMFIIANS